MGKRWASRFRGHGEVRNLAIPGRPHVSSWRGDIHLIREIRNHPLLTASELKVRSKFPGSTQTVRRHLGSYDLTACRAAPKVSLTDAQIVDCLAFASSQECFNWRNIIFSDEVTVSSSNTGPVLVYHMNGFKHDACFVTQHERSAA